MSKLRKEGQNWHYRSCFKSLQDKKKWNSACPLQNENEPKRGRGGNSYRKQKWSLLGVRESNFSLKIRAIRPSAVFWTRRRTTRRGLHVGTGFREFSQTSRGRDFSLLGFYSRFKYFTNV